LFVSYFMRKPLACSECARPANLRCEVCGEPVCAGHARLAKGWRVLCGRCKESGDG
jgi:formylmethanofuran dehydrogenase subunit E